MLHGLSTVQKDLVHLTNACGDVVQHRACSSCLSFKDLIKVVNAGSHSGGQCSKVRLLPACMALNVGFHDVINIDEVPFLVAVAIYSRLIPIAHRLDEDGNHSGFSRGILPGPVNIAIAQVGKVQPVQPVEQVNVLFSHMLRQPVGGDRFNRRFFATWVVFRIAINGPPR